MDTLLIKYLLEEATDEEQNLVEHWLAESESNQQYFAQINAIWENSKMVAFHSTIDENDAWKRFEERVKKQEAEKGKAKIVSIQNPRNAFSFKKIAVAASVLMAVSILTYFLVFKIDSGVFTTGNSVLVKKLPDQTIVTLNKNSSIALGKSFNKTNRELSLEGEAFFNVTPDSQKPFIIKSRNVEVVVVGTSFNVKNIEAGTEIIVESGIVEVRYEGSKIRLLPQQKILVKPGDKKLIANRNEGELYNYYRTQSFICTHTPLPDLVEVLNNAYDVNIKIANPAAYQMRITTRFEKQNINTILNVVATTLNLKVIKTDEGSFILK